VSVRGLARVRGAHVSMRATDLRGSRTTALETIPPQAAWLYGILFPQDEGIGITDGLRALCSRPLVASGAPIEGRTDRSRIGAWPLRHLTARETADLPPVWSAAQR